MSDGRRIRVDTGREIDRHREAVRTGYRADRRAVELGRAIRECREEFGLSQTDLARRAGT